MATICKKCYWCAEKVGVLNLWGNIILVFVKVVGGIVGRSQALIADSIHSISDVVIAILLLIGLKISGAPPDEDHRWGHGNIEYIVAAVIGALLIFVSVMIAVTSIFSILEKEYYHPGILAIWAAVISIALNEIMFRHSICIGKQMESPAMIANAWENRADVFSSVAALLGVLGARIGFPILDPLAALGVAFFIAKSGTETLISAVNGITDKSVDEGMLKNIEMIFSEEKEMKNISKLRARKIGQKTWIDAEITFQSNIRIYEVKKIIARIRETIIDKFDVIAGVDIIPRIEGM